MVCKAFIAASEDPFVGASQKGRDFKKRMHETGNPDSVHSRFKDTISASILTFLVIKGTAQQDSGSDDEQLYQKCKLINEQHLPNLL